MSRGFDAVLSWWLIDDADFELADALGDFLPRWITSDWPFGRVRVSP
jgi:hypothetical protein